MFWPKVILTLIFEYERSMCKYEEDQIQRCFDLKANQNIALKLFFSCCPDSELIDGGFYVELLKHLHFHKCNYI